ncbi:MAG: ArsA family ATPase [Myxococcales bacterium]|nr:ArsA family ATPase [Myxococcales bacterium]MCB9567820.1 ArsA family ATPase [Myxococcales bacterium]MCB9700266.1 ArsA family ATPase [Myxococcales bacterium]
MTPPASPAAALEALARRRLLIVSGKGGVGRTAVAAMLGRALARQGRRVLVATVGPDDRLAWMLGARTLESTPQAVEGSLFVQRVVPQVCIREYGALVIGSDRLASAVFDNKLMRRLFRTIPGLDDFAVLGKLWHEACRAKTFDTVIFDGPATGHLPYALGLPRTILRTISVGPLHKEAQLMQSCLEDPAQIAAVLVGLPDRWPLTELSELAAVLRADLKVAIAAIFINGLWPDGLPELAPPAAADDPAGTVAPVFAAITTMAGQRARQDEGIAAWRSAEPDAGRSSSAVLTLPWRWQGLDGVAAIDELVAQIAAVADPGR